MPAAPPRFSAPALSFLRALKRNNSREWFSARKAEYDRFLKTPMVALVEQLALDLPNIAPELIASPRLSIYRIYRDTRFSADKTPLKTHVAAIFPCRGLRRHESAALYVEIAATRVLVAGGLYAPQTSDLARVREHLARRFRRFLAIVDAPAFRRRFGRVGGATLKRVPRGFAKDHPAAEYLKLTQFLVWREYPAARAVSPRFYATVLDDFHAMAPLIRFLNEPLRAAARLNPDPRG